ncbi:putative N-acetyltransferase HLS1 [Cinnamomum micranthum f. kanehirae]|uniref:Putative N-acetyltransferase HLS1 n=1 Tax=Cinnamomum micranthum f. kanehirae TaxID=337451 RepID=A0A3S3PSQ4_9MAGN|nr:putative N-acetyltransferase HLS1 [Cinnamomum micranthum f. kanehirae]
MREESGVGSVVVVREFDPKRDCLGVEMVERRCEVGPTGKMSLYTDLMGDPICRVRHSPAFLMLVAEVGVDKEIVGVIRGCIKTVTCGKKLPRVRKKGSQNVVAHPVYTKLAYLLGLRVSPSHRRMGIGLKLVSRMENWFRQNGAEYSYMATEKSNEASLKLFTERCGYTKFRTPSILVQPVFAHRVKIPNRVTIFRLNPLDSETLYRRRFSTTEFFPRDIDSILRNKLNLGTFLAVPAGTYKPNSWPGSNRFLSDPPESWAVLSIWNSKEVFRLEVRGAPLLRKWLARTSRAVDRLLPWLRIPSVPEVFRPFGLHFMYGLGGEGPDSVSLTRALCAHAHNVARAGGCGVVATEVACADPLRLGIPHWKRLSCAEDLWCVKRLGEDYSDGSVGDWTKSVPEPSIFVDPREF